jgi:hypothetical protein
VIVFVVDVLENGDFGGVRPRAVGRRASAEEAVGVAAIAGMESTMHRLGCGRDMEELGL